MYIVTVRDHVMIAHSLQGEIFGPAQNLHGATYVIDAEFRRPDLDEHNVVIDIGLASRILAETAAKLSYRNLDEMEAFHGEITTTEYLAKYIHDRIREQVESFFKGTLKVTLNESHIASAGYEGNID